MSRGALDPIRGRGTHTNRAGRFERLQFEVDLETAEADAMTPEPLGPPRTQYFSDRTASIIATNDSPDVGFSASINPYRGCEHGCSYCYARPYHEYLGLSAGLDFESKIFVKQDAPELLRRELTSLSWKPQTLGLSGVTDAYQPIERHLKITRGCVEVLAECRNPVAVVTKNALVARDADLYMELAGHNAVRVFLSVTTLDRDLARRLEPRASSPTDRLGAIHTLADAGVPVGAMIAPVIPGLTDHEIPAIVRAVADAGGQFASYTILRLPLAVADLFSEWLADHEPMKKEKVLARVRGIRGGRLNESDFGKRMRGEGPMADHIRALFATSVRRAGLTPAKPLSTASFRRPTSIGQRRLFDLG
jgi:DNA repair photolyase